MTVGPIEPDLIYDVGLHDGQDSAYYLSKGYRVVAIEASPDFAQHAEQQFRAEIAAQRLTAGIYIGRQLIVAQHEHLGNHIEL